MRRVALLVFAFALVAAAPAQGQSAFVLGLRAPAPAEYGTTITLRGAITPVLADAPVTIYRDDTPIGTTTTDAAGRFVFRTRASAPAAYEARAGELASAPVRLAVRPRLRVRFVGRSVVGSPLRLDVRIEPATPIRVVVRRNGRVVIDRTYPGSTRIALATRGAARFTVRVSASAPEGWLPRSATGQHAVISPRLALGSRGASVRALEERLRELRYALPGVDGYFGLETMQAVMAFQKIERLPWTGRVDARVWQRLQRASPPRARYGGTHIEVSKGRQFLLVVRNGVVANAVHVSTGATGNTPLGRWRVYRKVPGWDWVLWYPMYFIGGFAIHGYPSVPAYPASHGCVRVPMWIAPRLYDGFAYGSTIYLYW